MTVWSKITPFRVNFQNSSIKVQYRTTIDVFPEFLADLSRYKEMRIHCTRYKKLPPFSPPFCAPLAQGAKILTPVKFYPDPLRFAGVIRYIIPSRYTESVCTVGPYADKNIKRLLILSKYICMTA